MSNPIIKEIAALNGNAEDVFVIHACFCPHGPDQTQRLACVYVQNIDRSYSERFSLEKVAKKNKIEPPEFESWYNDLEIYILDDINGFLKAKSNCTFIYWVEEGKELLLDLLQARFEELNKDDSGKVFFKIPTKQRKSIQVLIAKTGKHQAFSEDLKHFIKIHNDDQLINGFLNNGEESNHFDKQQFGPITNSVVAKVDFFVRLVTRYSATDAKKDKGSASPVEFRSLTPAVLIKGMTVGSWILLSGLLAGAFGLGSWVKTNFGTSEQETAFKNLQKQKTADSTKMSDSAVILGDSIRKLQQRIDSAKIAASNKK